MTRVTLVPVSCRVPSDVALRLEAVAGKGNVSPFVRGLIEAAVAGVEVSEPVKVESVGGHADFRTVLGAILERPGLGVRDYARILGWDIGKTDRVCQRLLARGEVRSDRGCLFIVEV